MGGVIVIFDTFKFWWKKWSGFFLHLIIGLLYFVFGITLLKNPVVGAVSLTLLLATLYIILGFFRIISSIALKLPHWGWGLFSGIIALVLGILIMLSWPTSGLFILGLFIGIDLIFVGWAYVMLALSVRSA